MPRTPNLEALAEGRRKAQAARKARPPAREFLDDDLWVELARKRKVRLPQKATPLTTAVIARALRKLGLTAEDWRNWVGAGWTHKKFVEMNPTWTARGFWGLMLELKEDLDAHKETPNE